MDSIIICRTERRALAAWLADEKFERPQTVPPQVWRQLMHAEMASIPFGILGELVDVLSPTVLEIIRWPETA